MAPKSNGKWRPCGDYQRLYLVSIPDRYPLPHLQDFASSLPNSVILSKIDLVRGYHQIPVNPDDGKKTVITTPFGLSEFLKMPFGLCNAGQTFQCLMNGILQRVPFTSVYIDDILVASRSPTEHLFNLRIVFQQLADHGLIIRRNVSLGFWGSTCWDNASHSMASLHYRARFGWSYNSQDQPPREH